MRSSCVGFDGDCILIHSYESDLQSLWGFSQNILNQAGGWVGRGLLIVDLLSVRSSRKVVGVAGVGIGDDPV